MALFAACVPASLQAGAEVLLYPFARAFGSPSEAELATCRVAFRNFQAALPEAMVVAQPVLVMTGSPAGARPAWRADLSDAFADRVNAARRLRLTTITASPAVPVPSLGHNQLRYAWNQARAYAAFVRTAPPPAPHVLFTEVWTRRGNVDAIHLYLINAAGQITYCRWFNSHHFGPQLGFDNDAWIEFAAAEFLRDLRRPPEQLFPKYGVG